MSKIAVRLRMQPQSLPCSVALRGAMEVLWRQITNTRTSLLPWNGDACDETMRLEGRQLIKRWQPDPELKLKALGGPIAKSICQLVCCQSTYEAWKRVIRVEALTGRSCKVHCSDRTTSFATISLTTSTTTTSTTNTYITTSTASTTSTLLPPLVLLLLYLLLLLQLARFELLGCSHHFQPSLPPLGKHLWPEPTQTRLKREPSSLFQPVWTKSLSLNDPEQQVLPRLGIILANLSIF